MSWRSVATDAVDPLAIPLKMYEFLGSPETPTTAHLIARIGRVLLPDARTALNATPGNGNFFSESVPTRLVVTSSVHDARDLPYADRSFDLVLTDLPHNADGGRESIMRARYDTVSDADIEPLFRAAARESMRVARLGLIFKVCPQVHGSRFNDQTEWIRDELGVPYQEIHDVRPRWAGARQPPQYSAYVNGAVYLIYRRGSQYHRAR
jgi:hypothetical protein